MKELEESQWWPRDKILELQNGRLRKLVKYSYDNVPYYRRIFDEGGLKPDNIQSSADLAKLPVLTKQIIRENLDQMVVRDFPSSEMVQSRTGGSTGEPLLFYITKDEQLNSSFARVRRAYRWWGYEVGDKSVSIMEGHIPRSGIIRLRNALERRLSFELWKNTEKLPLFVEKLERFQPKFISSYPSFIYILAKFIEIKQKTMLRPKAIITHSEQLYDFQRGLFKEVFGCESYSQYDSFEMNQIAAECPEHLGYHIAAESVIVDLVNDEGEPVPVGEEGRILITNLQNYAMPFIRYDTGDIGAASDKVCPCGRGLPLLAKLSGRTTDFLLTTSGRKIPGITLPWRHFADESIDQFQIIQEKYEEVIVKVVPSKESSETQRDRLTKNIVDQYKVILGEDMTITVEFVDQIPTTRTGKRRVVMSRLPDINGQPPTH